MTSALCLIRLNLCAFSTPWAHQEIPLSHVDESYDRIRIDGSSCDIWKE